MAATLLELYEKLKPKLGDQEARELLEFIEGSLERRAATKADLQRTETALREDLQRAETALREEITRVEQELRGEISRVEQELRGEISRVEQELRVEIQRVKADLLKWSFVFWVGSVAVLSSLILALFNAYLGR